MNNITGTPIRQIKLRIDRDWNQENGLSFSQNGWDFMIPNWNKKDVWATKSGTQGKTRKTFCRLSTKKIEKVNLN